MRGEPPASCAETGGCDHELVVAPTGVRARPVTDREPDATDAVPIAAELESNQSLAVGVFTAGFASPQREPATDGCKVGSAGPAFVANSGAAVDRTSDPVGVDLDRRGARNAIAAMWT
jgi:hypothetical protein